MSAISPVDVTKDKIKEKEKLEKLKMFLIKCKKPKDSRR